jgi:hypothetical protein
MKSSTDEKRRMVAALTIAMTHTSTDLVEYWKYANLRKKVETALRSEGQG